MLHEDAGDQLSRPALRRGMPRREHNKQPATDSFSGIINPRTDQTKNEMIEELLLSGRLHYNPEQFQIIERNNTAIMVNRSITAASAKAHREHIINSGIHFHGSISDHENIRALFCLRPNWQKEKPAKLFLTIGAWTWLMDYVSRHPNNPDDPNNSTTFLRACREQDFKFSTTDKTTFSGLRDKFFKVLETLKIADHPLIMQFVDEWYNKGTFTIPDSSDTKIDTHDQEWIADEKKPNGGDWMLYGAYTILAEKLCRISHLRFFYITAAVSYGLGNRDFMRNLDSNVDADIKASDRTMQAANDEELLNSIVEDGHSTRFQRMEVRLEDLYPIPAERALTEEGETFFRNFLQGLPIEALRAFYTQNYSLAYSEAPDISGMYPAGEIPGHPKEHCDVARKSPALMQPRWSMLFVSDGWYVYNSFKYDTGEFTREDRMVKLMQSVLHESVHMAINSEEILNDLGLSGDAMTGKGAQWAAHKPNSVIGRLKTQALKACADLKTLSVEDRDKYLGDKSLLDPSFQTHEIFSDKPPGKYDYSEEAWKEEILANLYAAAHGQYSKDRRLENNAFHSNGRDSEEPWQINQLREVTRALERVIKIIDQRLVKSQSENKIEIPDSFAARLKSQEGSQAALA